MGVPKSQFFRTQFVNKICRPNLPPNLPPNFPQIFPQKIPNCLMHIYSNYEHSGDLEMTSENLGGDLGEDLGKIWGKRFWVTFGLDWTLNILAVPQWINHGYRNFDLFWCAQQTDENWDVIVNSKMNRHVFLNRVAEGVVTSVSHD